MLTAGLALTPLASSEWAIVATTGILSTAGAGAGPMTFYVFAGVLGFTWLATVPPTAGLVVKLFGTRYLATLFGLTLLTHQVGGFLGAWLGGLLWSITEAIFGCGTLICYSQHSLRWLIYLFARI